MACTTMCLQLIARKFFRRGHDRSKRMCIFGGLSVGITLGELKVGSQLLGATGVFVVLRATAGRT